jgi:hypothetical protein
MAYNETPTVKDQAMFKKKAIQIKMVNAKDVKMTDAEDIPVKTVDPEEIAMIVTEYAVRTVTAIGVVIAANRVLSTICEVAIISAKAKIK